MTSLLVVAAIACQLAVTASTSPARAHTPQTSVAAEPAVNWQYETGG